MDNCNTHKIFKGIYREEAMKKKNKTQREKKESKNIGRKIKWQKMVKKKSTPEKVKKGKIINRGRESKTLRIKRVRRRAESTDAANGSSFGIKSRTVTSRRGCGREIRTLRRCRVRCCDAVPQPSPTCGTVAMLSYCPGIWRFNQCILGLPRAVTT